MAAKKSRLRDFDPESLLDPAPSSDSENSGSESEVDVNAGREHYENVGKSKLRKRDIAPLGPQYEGSRVSRDAAEDDDSDDPFARGFDIEDSDDKSDTSTAISDSVQEHGSQDGEAVFDGEGQDSEDEGESEEGDEDADDDGTDNDMEDDSEDEEADTNGNTSAEVRKMMAKESTAVAATISHAVKTDIEKGQAVKTQRKTFDTLLNTRIRLQKALICSNSLAALETDKVTSDESAIRAAETAALTLLDTLTNLRGALNASRTGQKRKSSVAFSPETTSSDIWTTITSFEKDTSRHRTTVLEKWSTRTRATPVVASSKSRLNHSAQQTLTDILQTHIGDSERLVKRTRIPRSCAPVQSAAGIQESADIYDDADFYGLLLKELLEQRSQDLIVSGVDSSDFVAQAPWQAAKEVRHKKVVDTKASKGRKLRYTVHEKLQNFMASESRGTWGERQRDELFGSLFGRKAGLVEEAEEDRASDDDRAEEGLMLFRG
ncbi:TRAUB-domain-containing protein [Delitschia confertaspora ATCC 74209]|uniref:Protein BFR2 n=1 Tax=Delitschia confertaspora ATCC 74209 TaxID=1513339 RepID=A0A9P4JIU5_9PLEO|nr:TRAUB-domain-containing protein [Delitschia confertaspora ATCC 74209]